jgi:hypothetical protein
MLTMKVLRKVTDPNIYRVIGLDGPRPPQAGLLNTFGVQIPVQPGDILALNAANGNTGCTFTGTSGDTILQKLGSLNDGEAGGFTATNSTRLNLTAGIRARQHTHLGQDDVQQEEGDRDAELDAAQPRRSDGIPATKSEVNLKKNL